MILIEENPDAAGVWRAVTIDGLRRIAYYDASERYRYLLGIEFVPHPTNVCMWIMLNPSTATEMVDDPTVRRCQTFSREWGYDGCVVTNIFAYRSTDPSVLRELGEAAIGPDNNRFITTAASKAARIVAAWGVHGAVAGRGADVRARLRRHPLACLGVTKDGHPRHPLYVSGATEPVLL